MRRAVKGVSLAGDARVVSRLGTHLYAGLGLAVVKGDTAIDIAGGCAETDLIGAIGHRAIFIAASGG